MKSPIKQPPYTIPQTRWKCPHCGAQGWYIPGSKVNGLFDHARIDGRRCLKAEQSKTYGTLIFLTSPTYYPHGKTH